jgi:hypothetical protein
MTFEDGTDKLLGNVFNQHSKVRYVKCQKTEGLNYTVAKTWNHAVTPFSSNVVTNLVH